MPKYLRDGTDGEGAPSSAAFNIPGTMKSSVSGRRWIGEGGGVISLRQRPQRGTALFLQDV